MPMNPNFLCCIGAELKNSTQQTTRMTQVYLYRAFEDETLSDMLSAGFFNEAIGIVRKDDLMLLYSPNEATAKWAYARVSNVDRDGVSVSQIGIDATGISVDTTDYSNISGDNLQEIMNSVDAEFLKYVKTDGTSIMTGPLKMRASISFKCAIAPSWSGVGFYKLNDDGSISLMASMEETDGLTPAQNNTYNIGTASRKWKNLYLIGKAYLTTINNGADVLVPTKAGTLALESDIGRTNCITQIPQVVNIELVSGSGIKIAAGTKYYVPNGSNTFTETTLGAELTQTGGWGSQNENQFVFISPNTHLLVFPAQYCQSGASADLSKIRTDGYGVWYDTTSNSVKWTENNGSTWTSGYSLPIAIVTETTSSNIIDRIDQVFNGFGYIGSTIFMLPGVTLVKPNGRNTNGTLENNITTTQTVLVNSTERTSTNGYLIYNPAGSIQKSSAQSNWYYDDEKNFVSNLTGNTSYMIWGEYTTDANDLITSFNPKRVFHAVDYSDTEYIAHQAMPSDRYIDLTLGTSGTTYTAPADGYFAITKTASAANEYVYIRNTSNGMSAGVMATSASNCRVCLPVSKGQSVTVNYTTGGTTGVFRFIYANGAK